METGKLIGLISCVSKKKPYPAKAKELYDSPLFIKAKEFAEKRLDKYYILSAKHGLLDPDQVIDPYDESLDKKDVNTRKIWAKEVFEKLVPLLGDNDKIVLLAGKLYRQFLEELIKKNNIPYKVPLCKYRIGEQLKWYNNVNINDEYDLDFELE